MRILDGELLTELEAAWQSQGAEIAGVLAPGLSDEAMAALVEPLGLTLPAEARIWWGWHDGVTVTTPYGWEIGPDIGFYSLAQAVEQYREERESVNEGDWPNSWLPFTNFRRGPLIIDCQADERAIVHRVNWEVGHFPGADSMGELVALWLEAMDTGVWSWNPEGAWHRAIDLAPPRMADMHVI
jgi:hypothetical protein